MRKSIIIYVISCMLCSCSVVKFTSGTFSAKTQIKGFNYEYKLILRSDSTFLLNTYVQDAQPECKGLWWLSSDTLQLRCDNVDKVTDLLTNNYLNERAYKCLILNSNKLRFNNVILRRIKNK